MKSSSLLGIALVSLLVLLGGCRDLSDHPLGPAGAGTIGEIGGGDGPVPESRNRGLDAQGHFAWQQVELVARDGSTTEASFRADYVVQGNGRAAGSFAFFSEEGIVVYRITGGEVSCVGGTDVVILNATAVGAGGRFSPDITVDLTPASDNPECIIWDIQDSCSHEATGKHEVLNSACGS